MGTNAGLGGLIGFSYLEADNGVQSLHKHRKDLEDFIGNLENLKVQNPEEWNGDEELMYQQLMTDARKGLEKINNNIVKMTSWINLASASHKQNENQNTSLFARAYDNAQV